MACCFGKSGVMCAVMAGVAGGLMAAHVMAPANAAQPEGMEMPSPEEMMKMMAEWAEPGEHHKLLDRMTGTFDCELKFWMAPGAPPEVSQGKCTNKWVLGGRQLQGDFKADFKFMGEVIPFEGIGYMGYDKTKEAFISVWMDTMSTGQMIQTGTADGDTITVEGVSASPMGESKMRNVYTFTDTGHTLEFYEPNPMTGEMMRIGQITYTRR